jgi:hypothetical protein
MSQRQDSIPQELYQIPLDAQDAEDVTRFQPDTSVPQQLVITPDGGISILMPNHPPASANQSDASVAETFEQKFARLTAQWRRETRHVSSLSKIAMNPSYQKIIGMGERAIPFILRDLRDSGGHWLWALHVITDKDPAPEGASFREAKAAWIDWGKAQKLLT